MKIRFSIILRIIFSALKREGKCSKSYLHIYVKIKTLQEIENKHENFSSTAGFPMIKIKEFDLQNVSVHYKWNNDEELNYYDSDYPHQHEDFDTFLSRIKSVLDERNETANVFEVHLAENDKMIGIVDIHAIDSYNRRCYVNCTIGDRDYAGKGYDVQALKRVLHHCFNDKGMHKVATTAFDFNTSWIESVKELGFQQEGQLREHVLKKDEFCDKLIFSLLKSDYKSLQKKAAAVAG